ncbi:unnamed protein product [Acanthoscelides obtectus]|uniref:Uncharacterized protein n=1 Tax=Acanthoscelides obtectus TaxID=200917 RepID=A0A9P0PMT0_ACAOB|nr:unnamed protein product [Acanthoscelides obtectus]CAK1680963.1 hypothetical protein AOBTE_LOCUS32960 [Acanthoscelides obtectus]
MVRNYIRKESSSSL